MERGANRFLANKALKNCPGLKYAPLGADGYFLVNLSKRHGTSERQSEGV